MWKNVSVAEKHHEERYRALLESIKNKKVFNADGDIAWICANCGHIHYGKNAPEKCPVCDHPQAYFMRDVKAY